MKTNVRALWRIVKPHVIGIFEILFLLEFIDLLMLQGFTSFWIVSMILMLAAWVVYEEFFRDR